MNKTELIAAVAEKTGLKKKDAEAAVAAVLTHRPLAVAVVEVARWAVAVVVATTEAAAMAVINQNHV